MSSHHTIEAKGGLVVITAREASPDPANGEQGVWQRISGGEGAGGRREYSGEAGSVAKGAHHEGACDVADAPRSDARGPRLRSSAHLVAPAGIFGDGGKSAGSGELRGDHLIGGKDTAPFEGVVRVRDTESIGRQVVHEVRRPEVRDRMKGGGRARLDDVDLNTAAPEMHNAVNGRVVVGVRFRVVGVPNGVVFPFDEVVDNALVLVEGCVDIEIVWDPGVSAVDVEDVQGGGARYDGGSNTKQVTEGVGVAKELVKGCYVAQQQHGRVRRIRCGGRRMRRLHVLDVHGLGGGDQCVTKTWSDDVASGGEHNGGTYTGLVSTPIVEVAETASRELLKRREQCERRQAVLLTNQCSQQWP